MITKWFTVGDIVRIKSSFLGEPENVLGYVYQNYNLGGEYETDGVSIITENGVDLGGFSGAEQVEYLQFVRKSKYLYKFKNVIQLDKDFENQIKPLFSCNCDRSGNCGC